MDPEKRFRAVFDLAYAPLWRYAQHRGLTGPDAEDLVAQVLEVAWRRIEDVPVAEPLPWLYAVARNLRRNQARRDRRRHELLARFRPSPPVAACEDPGGLEPGVLRAALASLSDSDQEVLRLVAWDGLPPPRSPSCWVALPSRRAPGCTAPAAAWRPGSASARACNSAFQRDINRVTAPIPWRYRDDPARR